jgi:hypothetical protein
VIAIDYCPWLSDDGLLVVARRPRCESWIQVLNEHGAPLGWVVADDGLVEETDREL